MGMMRAHSLFKSLGTAPRAMKIQGDQPSGDTVKARAKRTALELVGIQNEVISMDPGEVATTAMPSRMGYDDTIIEAEIPTEYGVDDSWIHVNEDAQGMGAVTVREAATGVKTPGAPRGATLSASKGLPTWAWAAIIGGAVLLLGGGLFLAKRKKG